MFIAGFDIGTTNLDLYVLDLEKAVIAERRSAPNPKLFMSDPLAYCQDVNLIVQNIQDMLASVKEPLSSICVTGQQHSILYVDGQGRPCSPLYTWLDQCGVESFKGTTPQKLLAEKTGVFLNAGYGFLTHYAMRLLKRIPPEARAWCGINEYVTGMLLGQGFTKTDSSFLASYGGFDPVILRFNKDFAVYANGDTEEKTPFSWPRLALPFSIAGTRPDGIPVAHPVGDNQASFYGLVARPGEECLISIGTSGQLSVFAESAECPPGMELRPFLGLGYILVGAAISSGKSYEVLERFFADIVTRYAKEKGIPLSGDVSFFDTMKAAALEQGSNGLLVDTTFNGTRQDGAKRGSINGISLNNFTMGSLTAATVSGIVRELAAFRSGLEARFGSIKRIITAGSAVKNPLFRRELENQFSAEICPGSGLGAALGSALIGAVSAGLIKQSDVCNIILALRKKT
ncbi:hypothetical protein FACS189485_12560 [Spirochaetia bacterium]|nr:hypothetical protein FACS189485_12560 [Spirochaetia bacterium]